MPQERLTLAMLCGVVWTFKGLFRWAVIHLDEQQLVMEIRATEVTTNE